MPGRGGAAAKDMKKPAADKTAGTERMYPHSAPIGTDLLAEILGVFAHCAYYHDGDNYKENDFYSSL